MVSDNVFVATVFIKGVAGAYEEQFPLNATMTMTRQQYEKLAVAINMGTNLPSCATPNGKFMLLATQSPVTNRTRPCSVRAQPVLCAACARSAPAMLCLCSTWCSVCALSVLFF